jgi:hypothetical protein
VVEERYESELGQSTKVLDDVDRALERLSDGTYHSCDVCGGALADIELSADPTRRVCGQHSGAGGLGGSGSSGSSEGLDDVTPGAV